MNIQTVIANLIQTIEVKEKVRDRYLQSDNKELRSIGSYIEVEIYDLNKILNDCMAVREADIIKDLEIKELQRQNSDYSWQVNPDRMGQ